MHPTTSSNASDNTELSAEGVDISTYTDVEHHFSTNINLRWQKMDTYYQITDRTPTYPAHKAVEGLWDQYKVVNTMLATTANDADDSDDDEVDTRDQYDEYCAELRPSNKHMTRHDSPIPYWLSKLAI
ncbi:hypothetical protein Q7P35_006599 [Cladosporium inversicolor]